MALRLLFGAVLGQAIGRAHPFVGLGVLGHQAGQPAAQRFGLGQHSLHLNVDIDITFAANGETGDHGGQGRAQRASQRSRAAAARGRLAGGQVVEKGGEVEGWVHGVIVRAAGCLSKFTYR